MLPRAREEAARNGRISDDGEAARQAELPAVSMAAEHKGITELLGLLICFRAVAKQNRGVSWRNSVASLLEIVRTKKVRIIHAANP